MNKKIHTLDLATLAKKHQKKGTKPQQFDIHINAKGQWFHQNQPIKRLALVRLFASVLTKLDDGNYWLITPLERGIIQVEDAPFYITDMTLKDRGKDRGKNQTITLKTSLGDTAALGRQNRLRIETLNDGQPRPYATIREGLEGLLARTVYYQLAEYASSHDGRIGVWSGGVFHPLE